MTNFLILAKGETISTARVVAVSADRGIVDRFLSELAGEVEEGSSEHRDSLHTEREPLRLVPSGGK